MPVQTSRRQLGRRLRAERKRVGITTVGVAEAGIMSEVTLWRIENGRRATKPGEIYELCRLYGTEQSVIDQLVALADATKAGADDGDDKYITTWLSLYLDLERDATALHWWHPWLIHAVLQTDDYARRVLTPDNGAHEEVNQARLRLRAERQKRALSTGTEISLVLAEAAFTQVNLGDHVLAAQHRALQAYDRLPGVDIRIPPPSVGLHPGFRGPFTIMEFADEADPSVVYLEGLADARYLDRPDHVREYEAAFSRLQELSIPIKEHRLP